MMTSAFPFLPEDIRVLERGWLSSSNIVCLGDAPAVIDTAHTKHSDQTVALVRNLLGDQALSTIAHTHLHSDHCGGTAALQGAWPDAQTWAPVESLPHVQAWDEDALTFGGTGQRCDRFTASKALVPGDTVRLGNYEWHIHAAPGHDTLAVLFHEPRHGILISGDAMWENGVGVIFPYIDGSDGFDTFTDTLALIDRLAPEVIIPGHGAPFNRASGALDAAMASSRQRIDYFKAHPAQHAAYATKVLIKYQMMDYESMPIDKFDTWVSGLPLLHLLHQQHRPDLERSEWLRMMLDSMFDKGTLHRTDTHVVNGT